MGYNMIRKSFILCLLAIVLVTANYDVLAVVPRMEDDTSTAVDDDFGFLDPELPDSGEPVIVDSKPADDEPEEIEYNETEIEEVVEPSIRIEVPTKIEGTIFEDLEKYEIVQDGSMAGTKYLTNNYIKENDEPVIVGAEILKDGEIFAVTGMEEENNFSLLESGNHKFSFRYGKNIATQSALYVNSGLAYQINKDALKYNGQDYSMVIVENDHTDIEKSYLRKIKESKKSLTEVFVIIDYSRTMREATVNGITRLEIVKESAKNFVNALFEEAEGTIAVGFIAFAYDAVVVKSPTDVKGDVINGINNFTVELGVGMYSGQVAPQFSTLNNKTGTNIGAAMIKAKESFVSEESNKVAVLFSDGAASAHNEVEQIYKSDSNEVKKAKLEMITQKTREDIKELIAADVRLISILNKTEGTEKKYVNKTFSRESGGWLGSYYEVDYLNKEAVTEALLEDVKSEIEEMSNELTTDYRNEKEFRGDDDPERRSEVNKNYEELYYDNLKLFQIVDELNGTEANDIEVVANNLKPENNYTYAQKLELYRDFMNSKVWVEEFIENSWMETEEAEVSLYEIKRDDLGRPEYITCGEAIVCTFEYYEEEGIGYCDVNGEKYKEENVEVIETVCSLNGALVRRDNFRLEIEQKITGVRLTLSDGTVLYNLVDEDAKKIPTLNSLLKEIYCKQLQYEAGQIGEIDTSVNSKIAIQGLTHYFPDSVALVVDTDLLQGATIEAEYTIIIKNNSGNATFAEEISIVDYFDSNVVYVADKPLITEDGVNADYGWNVLKTNDLFEKEYISASANREKERTAVYASFTQSGYELAEKIPEDGNVTDYQARTKYINPVIGNNGQRYLKIVLSKVLSAEMLDYFEFVNQAEILQYENNNYRRINAVVGDGVTVKLENPISGNYVPTDIDEKLSADITNIDEIDTAIACPVHIIPPTGGNLSREILKYIAIGLSGLTIVDLILIKRKKKK